MAAESKDRVTLTRIPHDQSPLTRGFFCLNHCSFCATGRRWYGSVEHLINYFSERPQQQGYRSVFQRIFKFHFPAALTAFTGPDTQAFRDVPVSDSQFVFVKPGTVFCAHVDGHVRAF